MNMQIKQLTISIITILNEKKLEIKNIKLIFIILLSISGYKTLDLKLLESIGIQGHLLTKNK
jgi:hypothetical protein